MSQHRYLIDHNYCYTTYYDIIDLEIRRLAKIEKFVLVTVFMFAVLLPLAYLKKRLASGFLKLFSWLFYILVPVLISYILGLMEEPAPGSFRRTSEYAPWYIIWAVFLLFTYVGLDNLSALDIEETQGRSKLFVQFVMQVILLLLFINRRTSDQGTGTSDAIPAVLVLLLVCLKVTERLAALAHAAGASPRIKGDIWRIINYMNQNKDQDDEDRPQNAVDATTMEGFKYLVGPRYSTIQEKRIVDGVTLEKIWGCKGWLLSSEPQGGDQDGQLKDSCLSFSLFWLLLGKFWGYPLYQRRSSSKMKAWRLIRHVLLATEGEHERAFRVIQVELKFLYDYFYSKYIFFYLNGFYWKLSCLAIPVLLWWVNEKENTYPENNPQGIESFVADYEGNQEFKKMVTTIVTLGIFALEALQLGMFVASRWLKVTLLCYYVKRKMSKRKCRFLIWCIEKFGALSQIGGSMCNSNKCCKPVKQELAQYSLLQSCTSLPDGASYLQPIAALLGIPVTKPGRKQGAKVVLTEQVKRAVVISLRTNGPTLSNGIASLRRNRVERDLSWACKLNKNTETILVWHIATSLCEMSHNSEQPLNTDEFKVATSLSNYCAYLVAFAPFLLPFPTLETESICDTVIEEARELFNKAHCPCGKIMEINKYEKMMKLLGDDNELGKHQSTTLERAAKLCKDLTSVVKDEGRQWKILAEFWAEMVLFLAPANNNEMAHAKRLAEGEEFITLLWALLVHAGIDDREDLVASGEDEPLQA